MACRICHLSSQLLVSTSQYTASWATLQFRRRRLRCDRAATIEKRICHRTSTAGVGVYNSPVCRWRRFDLCSGTTMQCELYLINFNQSNRAQLTRPIITLAYWLFSGRKYLFFGTCRWSATALMCESSSAIHHAVQLLSILYARRT